MSYIKTEWQSGDVVTAEKLNNVESGIEENDLRLDDIEDKEAVWDAKQDAIPENTYDAYGSAASVQGNLETAVQTLNGSIGAINGKIPAQATAQNQLADKSFVNSTVGTNTAIFRGTFDLVDDLGLTASATEAQISAALEAEITTVTNNDYCFVFYTNATTGITEYYDRYKYSQDDGFGFEFRLNNSSFTAVQWAAINSNITAALVALLSGMTHETWTFTLEDDTTVTKEVVVWQST